MNRIADVINEFRVFPRLMMMFMMYMMITFHNWFTQNNSLPVTEMSEWAIIGYGSVLATFVGFAKFYMDTRSDKNNFSIPNDYRDIEREGGRHHVRRN